MSEPVATWIKRNKLGEIMGRVAIYRRGENPGESPGEPSDDGRFVMAIDAAPCRHVVLLIKRRGDKGR